MSRLDRCGVIVGGKYAMTRLVAEYESHSLYVAHDLDGEHEVIVQVADGIGAADPDWSRRFRTEARVLTRVRHPKILAIEDYGQLEDSTPFLVAELPRGVALARELRDGPLSPSRAVKLLLQVARGLWHANQYGVFHLNVAAEKLFVDEEGGLQILDFMSARWHQVDPQQRAIPDYRLAAPELFRGEAADARAEVYGLGLLAYHCVVGKLPVEHDEEASARAVHLSPRRWTLPKEIALPEQLAKTIQKAMSKERHKRFENCGELATDLEKWLESVASTQRLPAVSRRVGFPKVGETFADKYLVEGVTGQGGFARVFKAKSLESGRVVALKVLRPDHTTNSAEARRFVREGKLVFTLLTNPHTISVYGYGETPEGLLYIAFEFIDGVGLDEALETGPLGPTRVVKVLEQTLVSLAEAHGMGVLHRDIKPSNIMLSTRDGVPDWVTVLDFGVAKIASDVIDSSELTIAGKAVGTPRYMSPEQISGDPLGPESDLYSLGLVAYELLAGETAIQGDDVLAVLSSQLDPQSVILPPSAGVPVPLALIVNRMVRKDRRSRYESARDVLADLMQLGRAVEDGTVDTSAR